MLPAHLPGISTLLGAGPLAQGDAPFWLPPPDSTTAGVVDPLLYFLLYLSLFFFALIVGLMLVFVIVYRRRPGVEQRPAPKSNLTLELLWTAVPIVVVVIIFYWGFVGYMQMRLPPREHYEIEVVGRQWSWMFKYGNGHIDTDLHVPVDRPVQLLMRSEDVIHSLWIPAFRVKMDLVPGRYTKTWFKATRPGIHALFCAEYCGTRHADMTAAVIVHEPGQFEVWLEDAAQAAGDMTPAERGEYFYNRLGCFGCHSLDGTARTGPSLKGIFGETHRFNDGTQAKVDENYIRESILDPSAKVRQGYRDQMNSYQGQISDEQIDAIIALIKSIE
jgi:cytochrome c oxidase subunit II